MAGSQKSGIRWWMWISIILGGAASFLLVTILMRRREAKGDVVPVRRIELKPKPRSRPDQPRRRAKPKPARSDDLTVIEGIGPKIEKMLNDELIYTWAELAAAPVDRLKGILRKGGDRYKMHDPTSWPDQAKLAAQGRWKELEELQDILQGGREG